MAVATRPPLRTGSPAQKAASQRRKCKSARCTARKAQAPVREQCLPCFQPRHQHQHRIKAALAFFVPPACLRAAWGNSPATSALRSAAVLPLPIPATHQSSACLIRAVRLLARSVGEQPRHKRPAQRRRLIATRALGQPQLLQLAGQLLVDVRGLAHGPAGKRGWCGQP